MNEQKLKRFNKIYPWFEGISCDLLFWIAIDTLFLSVVKKLTASQIVSLTSISMLTCILLQMPLLKVIKKIGNTNSVRLGAFFFLLSSLLITFGTSYIVIVIGKIFYEMAYTLHNMINAVLKNNLELQNKEDEYVKYRTSANTVYAVITMLIAFVASIMFNINNYLPMICCIAFCLISLVLSFFVVDYSNNNISKEKVVKPKVTMHKKINASKALLITVISYALGYSLVSIGQSDGKLFAQQDFLEFYNVEQTALLIGQMVCISRIVRVFSNIIFNKILKKIGDKVQILITITLSLSFVFMIGGYYLSFSIVLKVIFMNLAYIIILFIRDPFAVYMQDLALKEAETEQRQSILTVLELSKKILSAIVSLCFTAILVKNPMIDVIAILAVLAAIEVFISIYLYRFIVCNPEVKKGEKVLN